MSHYEVTAPRNAATLLVRLIPPARQHFKARCGIGAFDNLDGPSAEGFQRVWRLRPLIRLPAS